MGRPGDFFFIPNQVVLKATIHQSMMFLSPSATLNIKIWTKKALDRHYNISKKFLDGKSMMHYAPTLHGY